jgi:membrane dipeptidase
MFNLSFLLLSLFWLNSLNAKGASDEELLKKAKKIHSQIVTIDTHTDTPLLLMRDGFDLSGKNPSSRGKVDLKKMKQGGLDAAFFAVFIGQGDRTPERYNEVHNRALSIFDSISQAVSRNSELAEIALVSNDAKRLKKLNKRAIYIGVENGYPIGTDINRIDQYYNLGARYLTLSHTRNNQICDSSTDPNGPEHGGLSQFGVNVIKRLNELGMMIDVSHISDDAFYQVLEHSKVPVIASHSNVKAICDNPRNLSDDMLIKLAKNGGVIQMCLLSSYIKKDVPQPERDSARAAVRAKHNNFQNLSAEERRMAMDDWYAIDEKFPPIRATVSDLVDHIDYVVKKIGIDYVGIGSDFDGGGAINGCNDASEMINITVELLRRGYNKKEIEKIWGKNFLRVFKENERYAKSLKKS